MTSPDYRTSHLEQGKGDSYHATFSLNPYRHMVWKLEQGLLDRIIDSHYGGKDILHLDFACGTGRVLNYLADRAKVSVGVDVSRTMLDVARRTGSGAELIEADLTAKDVLGERQFNLITAFRFFPNAQPELRTQVIRILRAHLARDGFLVFNNHKNVQSTRNRIGRLLGRKRGHGMSTAEVEKLLSENGLEIVKAHHLCVFPASTARPILPISVLSRLEGALSRIDWLHNFGENILYVCRKRSGDAQ